MYYEVFSFNFLGILTILNLVWVLRILWPIYFSVVLSPTLSSFLSYRTGHYLSKPWRGHLCRSLELFLCSPFSLVCFSTNSGCLGLPEYHSLSPQPSEISRLIEIHTMLHPRNCFKGVRWGIYRIHLIFLSHFLKNPTPALTVVQYLKIFVLLIHFIKFSGYIRQED